MTQTTTTTLTPAQFTASRTLADAYSHLWSSVPDGTYNIDDIEAYSASIQSDNLPGGIYSPTIQILAGGEMLNVVHTTGSGRLRWTIQENGNVRLAIYRPADLSYTRSNIERTMAYAAIQAVSPPEDQGILVASVEVFNGENWGENAHYYGAYEIEIGTKDYQVCHDELGEVLPGWNYFGNDEDELHTDLLFERHVHALVRPLVALITANNEQRGEQEDYDTWRERILVPAINKAKEWLKPLFEVALPDPIAEEAEQKPETYWSRNYAFDAGYSYEVVHIGECFPVESEKTAVCIVLLLHDAPETPLIDAVKAAIRSRTYRPPVECEYYL